MRIALDLHATRPVSEQVFDAIATRVRRGSLAPGERLPTVRALAAELGIAPNTVAKAYRQLEADGLIEGRGRLGTFVTEGLALRADDGQRRLTEAARAFVRRSRQLGFGDAEMVRALRRALREW